MTQKKQLAVEWIRSKERLGGRDWVAVEEPLEIRLRYGSQSRRRQENITLTMRTPGQDADLAFGLLFSEGIISRADQIQSVRHAPEARVLLLESRFDFEPRLERLDRRFAANSSCGICGKSSLEGLEGDPVFLLPKKRPLWSCRQLYALPQRMREQQSGFEQTGGLHAAGLFDARGELILLREDIGRHNALDKLIGAALQRRLIPLSNYLTLLSSRASFELAQKALMAGIPFLAAVGAASSLAVSLADGAGMTLVGFLRGERCNVYTGGERLSTNE